MKRGQLIFPIILVPLDYLMLLAAAITAYRLRFEALTEIRPAISLIPFPEYLLSAALIGLVWIGFFALTGLYVIRRPRRKLEEAVKVILASTFGIMGVIIFIFFRGELFTSRFVVLAAWILAFVYVIVGRQTVRIVQYFLLRKGITAERVVIVGGEDATTSALVEEYSKYPQRGYVIVKRVHRWSDEAAAEIVELMKARGVDEIFLTDTEASRATTLSIIEFTEDHHLTFRYAADTLATHTDLMTTTVAGIPVIEVKRTRLEGWGRVYKRVFDVIASIVLIVLTSPIMLLATIIVFLDSRGPIIFKNERVGLHGNTFDVFKFRSMVATHSVGKQFNDQRAALAYEQKLIREKGIKEGPIYKIKDDPRITRVGKFLRRYSIDELPQLFNVLNGNMSLVGPRPHQPREVAKYQRHHRRVLMIRPGITGLAQVSGRSDLDFEDEMKLDTFYIENWTPLMDTAILFKTPYAVLTKKGVY